MNRRLLVSCVAVALLAGFVNPPIASAQQSVNFFVGAFVPRGFDGRDTSDVLYQNAGFLDFRMKDFNGATAGAEYLVQLGDFFDAGLGVGIYSRSVRTSDLDFQHPNGALVEQDLKLRMIPVTATFRFLPLGHHDAIVPYFGGGVGIYRWRYSEIGEFVDRTGRYSERPIRGERYDGWSGHPGRRANPRRNQRIGVRRRDPVAGWRRRSAARSGFCRHEDRFGRVQLSVHNQRRVLVWVEHERTSCPPPAGP